MELSITLTTSQCSLYIGVSRSCNSLPRTRGGSDSQDGRDPHQQPTRRDSAQPDQAITGNGFSDLSTCFQLRAGSGALPVPSRLRSGSGLQTPHRRARVFTQSEQAGSAVLEDRPASLQVQGESDTRIQQPMRAEKLSKSLLDETTGRLHGVDRLVF